MVVSVSNRQEALGQSEVFLDFQDRLSRVAPVDRPVLLLGERGTGKTRLAKMYSGKDNFVTANCASFDDSYNH